MSRTLPRYVFPIRVDGGGQERVLELHITPEDGGGRAPGMLILDSAPIADEEYIVLNRDEANRLSRVLSSAVQDLYG